MYIAMQLARHDEILSHDWHSSINNEGGYIPHDTQSHANDTGEIPMKCDTA